MRRTAAPRSDVALSEPFWNERMVWVLAQPGGVPVEGVGRDDRLGRRGRPSPPDGRLVEEAVRLLRVRISAHARVAAAHRDRRCGDRAKGPGDRQPRRVLARTHAKSRGRRIHARTDADGADRKPKTGQEMGVAMPEQAVQLISLRRQMRLRFRAPSVGERSTASASIPAINARERRLDVTRRALAIPRLSQSSRG